MKCKVGLIRTTFPTPNGVVRKVRGIVGNISVYYPIVAKANYDPFDYEFYTIVFTRPNGVIASTLKGEETLNIESSFVKRYCDLRATPFQVTIEPSNGFAKVKKIKTSYTFRETERLLVQYKEHIEAFLSNKTTLNSPQQFLKNTLE